MSVKELIEILKDYDPETELSVDIAVFTDDGVEIID
jgi:hypothetical protein